MLAQWYWAYDVAHRATLVAVGIGLAVACVVYLVLSRVKAQRRQLALSSGDLPWPELLELLRARHLELVDAGTFEETLPPDELLILLMSRLPAKRRRRKPVVPPEEREYLASGGADRRSSIRRWGTPTEVYFMPVSPYTQRLYLPPEFSSSGMVINRSEGGLAIFVDQEVEPTKILMVRALEAPNYVPTVQIEVKHCRKLRGKFLLGCQFTEEVPWNVMAWFG
jgi:hypothetical protein